MSTLTEQAPKRPLLKPKDARPPKSGRDVTHSYPGERLLRNSVVGFILVMSLLLLVIPIVLALVGSFHYWNPLNGTFDPVGLENYKALLTDREFWTIMWRTVVFSVVVIFFRLALGLALALAIFSKLTRGKTFFRALFYMPTVAPLVAVAYVWRMMYQPQVGAINTFLGLDINWLKDPQYALIAVMIMTIWKDFGYAVILFLSGLHSVPEDAMEAAEVDGCGPVRRFWYVTFPLLRPMTLFVAVTSIIAYLQAYVQIMVLTQGGPGTSTYLVSYLIFDRAFQKYDFGLASAIAFILLIFTSLLTYAAFKLYGGKDLFKKGGAK